MNYNKILSLIALWLIKNRNSIVSIRSYLFELEKMQQW